MIRIRIAISALACAAGTVAGAAPQASSVMWPNTDRAYFCRATRAAAPPPAHYVRRLREQIVRLTAQGATTEDAARQIGLAFGCNVAGSDFYASNWPAIDAPGNAFLCADQRGEPPAGYVQHVQRALLARVDFGMSLGAAADDIRAQGGCQASSTATTDQ